MLAAHIQSSHLHIGDAHGVYTARVGFGVVDRTDIHIHIFFVQGRGISHAGLSSECYDRSHHEFLVLFMEGFDNMILY